MDFGIWNEKYSVKNIIIDEQHRKLLDILYRLEKMVTRGKDHSEMVKLLSEMSDYANAHFKSEERYMEKIGYPNLSEHKKLHSQYSLEVLRFTLHHLDDNPNNARDVLNFLTHWWTDHILKVDMDYSVFAEKHEFAH
jgi:hemerythrin